MWFIHRCSEENSTIPGVGVDQLLKDGRLEKFKNGPLFWVDSADTNPCMGNYHSNFIVTLMLLNFFGTGTASAVMWKMRIDGRLFHSGLPHKVLIVRWDFHCHVIAGHQQH